MSFKQPVFYDISKLSMEGKIELLYDCKEICYKWFANKLDCSVSWARQRFDCTFEEIVGHLKEKSAFVVIDRGTWGDLDNIDHFEVGFRSMETIDYFLFIEVESGKMPPILKKYSLCQRER